MVITRTPLRLSLIGGGTDMDSFTKKHPGAVISMAIDKYIYVCVNQKFDGKVRVSYSKTENVNFAHEVEHDLVREALKMFSIKSGLEITSVSDVPGNGTGLGSSSAFTVGLIKALKKDTDPGILASLAYDVEAIKCNHPIGKQDIWASAYGGMNFFIFGKNSVQVTPLTLSANWMQEFKEHSLLLWTGITRDANDILRGQDKGFRDGGNVEVGKQLAHLAHDFYQELLDSADMKRLGELLHVAWNAKKMLSQGISNMKLDTLYSQALNSGAFGGKVLGAGGGGFFFFLAPPDKHNLIAETTGMRKIDFNIEMEGSKVIYDG